MRPYKTGLTLCDRGRATPGFTLYAPLFGRTAWLLDMAGEAVHRWALPGNPGGYARLLPNGNLFYAAHTEGGPPFQGGAKGGCMREVDWDGRTILEYRDEWQHHDCRRLPDGNLLYAGWEKMPVEAAAKVRGGLPGTETGEGMFSDFLKEVTPAGETVWEWHAHADMAVEDYPLHPLCPRRVFAWCNTCVPLDDGDVLIVLRQINLVAVIDRRTKRFKWERRDESWGHPHDCQKLANGNLLLFANGMNTAEPHPHSRVVEFDPATGETAWTYRDDPRNFFYSHHISGAERLASGNTLICEGSFGRIFEVTPAGDIVWEFVTPHFHEAFFGDKVNWVFRAFRYGEDSPEIAGRVRL